MSERDAAKTCAAGSHDDRTLIKFSVPDPPLFCCWFHMYRRLLHAQSNSFLRLL
jgi:hypothetical protein